MASDWEEPNIERLRRLIVEQYEQCPTGCGNSFGELLCFEIHGGFTFTRLADKWGVPVTVLGELVWDHCKRLEDDPFVNHLDTDRRGDMARKKIKDNHRIAAEGVSRERRPNGNDKCAKGCTYPSAKAVILPGEHQVPAWYRTKRLYHGVRKLVKIEGDLWTVQEIVEREYTITRAQFLDQYEYYKEADAPKET